MKKKKLIFTLCAATLMSLPLALLAGCGTNNVVTDDKVTCFNVTFEGNKGTSFDGYVNESGKLSPTISAPAGTTTTWTFDSSDTDILDVDNGGTVYFKAEGTATVTVTANNSDDGNGNKVKKVLNFTVLTSRLKSGVANYAASSYTNKLDITAALEKYAIDNQLTGLTLFENGGKIVYSKRINFPTTSYITGYGYGVLSDGTLTGNLKNNDGTDGVNASTYPGHADWANYYHSGAATGIKNICYMDDQGSVTADLYGNISSSLYGTELNADKNGYQWKGILAKSDPIPCEVDANNNLTKVLTDDEINNSTGLFSSFKIYVKTGNNGVKYSTLSSNLTVAGYNNRLLKLEDYVTGYRNLITKRNSYYRGAEQVSLTSSGSLKGSLSYYNSTGKGTDKTNDKTLFNNNVGLKTGSDDGGEYLVYTLNSPLSIFYAKYNLGSNLSAPVPQEFLDFVGPTYYGKGNENNGLAVKDSVLSVGPYIIEEFDTTNGEYVFKKNENYQSIEPGKYVGIPGIHMRAYETGTDSAIMVKNFKNGLLDAASLTKETINESFAQGIVKKTEGDSTFKLNINSCTQEEWVKLFGVNGTISQQSTTDYWKIKPFMSNKNFLNGISFAINREEYATARGVNPSQDYFAPSYMWDPEGNEATAAGISASYSNTKQHKDNLANYYPDTYGYNLEASKTCFRNAINEMVSNGDVTLPYKGEMKIIWMNTGDTKEYGADLEKYIEDSVNSVNSQFKVDVVNVDGSSEYSLVYEKMRKGQFDLGFGSISGSSLDPLGFMEVLKSDNSSGFTLNFGTDTSKPDGSLVYKDKVWSYDSLWTAANKGAIINDEGYVETSPVKADTTKITKKVDGNYTVYTLLVEQISAAGAEINLSSTGNIAVISYEDKSIASSITTQTYAIGFDDIASGFEIKDAVGTDATKTYKNIVFKIPTKIDVILTADEESGDKTSINSKDYTKIELTCNYNLTIDTDQGKIPTNSSYSIKL
jgi:ABC-type oligopeptide transport system substrate-binding subunit